MTLREYQMLMEAHGLKQIDDLYLIKRLAWENQQATATDKKGKSAFKGFDDFFDYQKAIDRLLGKTVADDVMADKKLFDLMRKANTRKED